MLGFRELSHRGPTVLSPWILSVRRMNVSDDIERLDRGIRALKVQYDQYLAGALATPPLELQDELERLVKKYSNAPIRRLAERFHFNTLVSRFNSYTELWGKLVRAREEGRDQATMAAALGEAAAADGGSNRQASSLLYQQMLEGTDDRAQLRPIYERYLEARRTQGQGGEISFANFSKQILRKSEAVKNRAECDAIRLRLTLDGDRVLLKALPVRRRKDG